MTMKNYVYNLLLMYLHGRLLKSLAYLEQLLDFGLKVETLISYARMEKELKDIMMSMDSSNEEIYIQLRPSTVLQIRKLYMQEFLPEINSMTLNDKKDIYSIDIRSMIISAMLLAVSISSDQDCNPFWTEHYQALSQNLWLPTKIVSAVSGSNYSNIYSKKNAVSNSWFSIIKKLPHKKSWSQTCFPSLQSFQPEPMVSENTNLKSRKILIYPTLKQKKCLIEFFGLSRWFYNRTIDACEKHQIYNHEYIKSVITKKRTFSDQQCPAIKKDVICNAPCSDHKEFCNKHIPKSNRCPYIIENDKKNTICNTKCIDIYCCKHEKQNKCQGLMLNKKVCNQPCKNQLCSKHETKRRVSQYDDVLPDWYTYKYVKDKKTYIPRFITGAITDCTKAYKSAFGLLKNGHITHFNMNPKTKKDRFQTLYVEKSCFSTHNVFLPSLFTDQPLKFAPLYTGHKAMLFKDLNIQYDGRIQWDQRTRKWYYIYVYPVQRVENQNTLIKRVPRIISLDSGGRTFQTGYSPNGHVLELGTLQDMQDLETKKQQLEQLSTHRKRKLKRVEQYIKHNNHFCGRIYGYWMAQDKLRKKIDQKRQSKRCKKIYWKAFYRLSLKIERMMDDLHWRIISYLTTHYDMIVLGDFNIKSIVKNLNHMKKVKRCLLTYKHGEFKKRLEDKCKERGIQLHIQNEACTSKTCTNCGWYYHTLGSNKTYHCSNCQVVLDRDINGARNILLRSWFEGDCRFPMRANASPV